MVRFNGRVKRSSRSVSPSMSPVSSPNLQDPVSVKKGIDDIKSPEPEYTGSPPATEIVANPSKGYTVNTLFNEKDIRQKLTQLYDYRDIPINELNPDALSLYQYLQSYVRILYGTNEYPAFYGCVRDIFQKADKIKVGTVGSYFKGCSLSVKNPHQKGCSAVCAGALPVPSSSNEILSSDYTCQYPVYIGVYSNGVYKFSNLNNSDKKENAIVFLVNNQKQASITDVTHLKSLGIKSASVYSTSEYGDSYNAISEGFVSLDTIGTSTKDIGSYSSSSGEEDMTKFKGDESQGESSTKDTNTSSSSSQQGGLSYGGKVAIGLLVAVIAIIIIALIVQVILTGSGYYKNHYEYSSKYDDGSNFFESVSDWFDGMGSFFNIKY